MLIAVLVVLAVAIVAGAFTAVNTNPVELNYFAGSHTLAAGYLVLGSFIVGGLVATLLVGPALMRRGLRAKRLERRARLLEQQLEECRAAQPGETTHHP